MNEPAPAKLNIANNIEKKTVKNFPIVKSSSIVNLQPYLNLHKELNVFYLNSVLSTLSSVNNEIGVEA
jgi:hypothetical protein